MDINSIITDVRISLMDNMKNLRAFADIVIGGNFVCKSFKVMDGVNGLWVSMPSRPKKNGEWEDIFHPITAEGRTQLFELILDRYNKALEEGAQQPSNSDVASSSISSQNNSASGLPAEIENIPEDDMPF
jgi:stage V sporulation protein G